MSTELADDKVFELSISAHVGGVRVPTGSVDFAPTELIHGRLVLGVRISDIKLQRSAKIDLEFHIVLDQTFGATRRDMSEFVEAG